MNYDGFAGIFGTCHELPFREYTWLLSSFLQSYVCIRLNYCLMKQKLQLIRIIGIS